MLPISSKETVRFTPVEQEKSTKNGKKAPKQPAPVYLLAVPTVAGRAAYTRELHAEGAVGVTEEDRLARLRGAIAEVAGREQQTQLSPLLDKLEQKKKLTQAESALLVDVERQVCSLHSEYAQVFAELVYAKQIGNIVACRMFLKGAEGLGVTFETDARGFLTLDTLDALPAGHIDQIGGKLQTLLWLPREKEKN